MEGEAAYCLGLAYHSVGEEKTAVSVSLSDDGYIIISLL